MIRDIYFMDALITIENAFMKEREEGCHEVFVMILEEFHSEIIEECLELVDLKVDKIQSEEELKKICDRDFFEKLKNLIIEKLLNSKDLKAKMDSIKSYYNLSNDEAKFLHLIFLHNEATVSLYLDSHLNSKFSNPSIVCEGLARFFKMEPVFINNLLFLYESNLYKFRIMNYEKPKCGPSFLISNYFYVSNDMTFESYLLGDKGPLPELDAIPKFADKHFAISKTLEKNDRYFVDLQINSNLFAKAYMSGLAEKMNKKFIFLDYGILSNAIDLEKINLFLLRLTYFPLEDHLILISLDGNSICTETGEKIKKIILQIKRKTNIQIFFKIQNYKESIQFVSELLTQIDLKVCLDESDRSTREIIYEKILGEKYTAESMLRLDLSYGALEEIMYLKLTPDELTEHIKYAAKKESIPLNENSVNQVDYSYFTTNIPSEKIKDAVLRFINLKDKKDNIIDRLTFLFSGPPGTGKSLLAESICFELGLSFKKVRFSDLKSVWAHESEIKTRDFFDNNSNYDVLIFDEIDSLLQNREGASRKYEVSEVNEFLNCMDNFKGVLFATTNLPESMDAAGLRRFDFKIKFDYLRPEIAFSLFNNLFKDFYLTQEDKAIIQNRLLLTKGITPAIISNIYRQTILMDNFSLSNVLNQLDEHTKCFKSKINLIHRYELSNQ